MAALMRSHQDFHVLGFTDPDASAIIPNLTHLGEDIRIPFYFQEGKCNSLALGVGMKSVKQGQIRSEMLSKYRSMGLDFPTIVSQWATIDADVTIGKASMVSMGACVVTGTRLGTGVIVNTKVSIDHDCHIGDFCHIAPGSILCGGVELGENVIIGAGAIIKEGLRIVADTQIGAGAVVLRDVLRSGTYVGNPARALTP